MDSAPLPRRALLRAVAGLTLVGGFVASCASRVAESGSAALGALRTSLPTPKRSLAPLPADPAACIDGLSPLITPKNEFFRIDVAGDIPMPSADTWKLQIDGLVTNRIELGYDELLARGLVEIDATIACVSNDVGGFLVGNARWTGVPLRDLITEARPLPEADEVMGHSVDGFTAGFPLSVLADRDAIIAVGMNGKPLEPVHGYPARIIVPGLYGYVSAVKWLSRIELTRFDEQVGYWIPRGWSELAPVKLASRIDTPRGGLPLAASATAIAGVAWSATDGIARVQVRVDAGSWLDAELGPALSNSTWRQWWIPWTAEPGKHRITVRAWDGVGNLQSSREVPPAPNGAEGLHSIEVTVS